MPDLSLRQGRPVKRRRTFSPSRAWPKPISSLRAPVLIAALLALLWPSALPAQNAEDPPERNPFDIAIIIDNRVDFETPAARTDVDRLFRMLDRYMFFDQIVILERPDIEVICDVFGCADPGEASNPFPPLIWQITRQEEARLLVYYLGAGRFEGQSRQLLFKRTADSPPGDVVPFEVDWLHDKLEDALPRSAVLMMDTGFSPRPLPCANDDPLLITDALLNVRRNYQGVIRRQRFPSGHVELAATTPVQPPHCDRIDRVLEKIDQPLFTKFLLKGVVDGEADEAPFGDGDRLIELGEITAYLDDRLKHAARFQWGRLQNVRSVGPDGHVLAAIDRRELREVNAEVFKRRNPMPAGAGTEPENAETSDQEMNKADFLQLPPMKDVMVSVDGEPGTVVTPTETADDDIDTRMPPGTETDDGPSGLCAWAGDVVAPYAGTLLQAFEVGTAPSCRWAIDHTEPEMGPLGQILTPIAWRLGRTRVKDGVACLLACDEPETATTSPTSPQPTAAESVVQASSGPAPTPPKTPFAVAMCYRLNHPAPFYIGLPQWMPGTLMIWKAVRAQLDCVPTPVVPRMPTPTVIAIRPPPVICPSEAIRLSRLLRLMKGVPPSATSIEIAGATIPFERLNLDDVDITLPPTRICIPIDPDPSPVPGAGLVLSASEVRWLQSALTVDNRNPGPIDGRIGPLTLRALNRWQADNGRQETTNVPEADYQDIIEEFGERFEQVQAIDGVF